jgi:transposase
MRAVTEIRDFGHLQQVAVLLEKENQRLLKRLETQSNEIATLRGLDKVEALQLELEKLKRELDGKAREGSRNPSERRDRERPENPPKPPQRGHGPTEQLKLPRRIEEHELAPDERCCPSCSGELVEWPGQFEEAEEITTIERRYEVVVHRRKKYRCRCNGAVVTAPAAPKLVPGGRYSIAFAIAVALAKYLEHMPLGRQARSMVRGGLQVTRQALWDQLDALALILAPCLVALQKLILSSQLIHADETWWRLLRKKATKNWWTWCLRTKTAVLYSMLETRGNDSARVLLGNFAGILMADAYVVYRSLARAGPQKLVYTLAHCWVHVRRRYWKIQENYPSQCAEILDLIGALYHVERDANEVPDGEDPLEYRRRLRDERSRPIVEKIWVWANSQWGSPESELRKAIKYMQKIWPELTRFLDDPRIPLDNNPAEQSLRGPVLGRKNHYGSRSKRGLEVAAALYSLLETAQLCGVNPADYLKAAVEAELKKPGTALLPHQMVS